MINKYRLLFLFLTASALRLFSADSSIVAVIYNSNSVTGYNVASYYAEKRGIPEKYLIGIPLVSDEVITKDYYYTNIRDVLRSEINSRGIRHDIKYLVTTKGMPLKIRTHQDYCEGHAQTGGGAVESFLCLLFDDSTDYCTTPRIVNPYQGKGEPFKSFNYEFIAFCPDQISGKISYLVSRLDAFSQEDIYKMIDRAAEADTSGTGYYIIDDHPGAQGFEPWAMSNAALNLSDLNLRQYVIYDSTTFHIIDDTLKSKAFIGYCGRGKHALNYNTEPSDMGWSQENGYLGGNRFNWRNGAIFTTYESFNGYSFNYEDDGCPYFFPTGQKLGHRDHQNLVADFIRAGGTAGIGNVYEPFLSGVSKVDLLFKYYAEGHYFIDAAYMSLNFLTGMNVVVGDPLCRISNKIHPSGSIVPPKRVSIESNFPNPFSGSTRIRYTITSPARVKLTVFNLLGEEVMVLPEELKSAATHDLVLSFASLPSGIYVYILEVDGFDLTGKLVHFK